MFALVGFAVGYVVGAQQGREGMAELLKSLKTIQSSEEFAAMLETTKTLVGSMLQQAVQTGSGVVAGEVKGVVNRRLRAA